mmetsp:Transcript_15994/g.15401  ORF Transcript_15994/g.15401 Transcript_15994/m.15401 type:complete len:82 (+) Transcript_15994:1645-1890(+)
MIQVLFVETIDKAIAINLEKLVNNLIMNVNDLIDDIEIRQRKQSMQMMASTSNTGRQDLIRKNGAPVRNNSTDVKTRPIPQ